MNHTLVMIKGLALLSEAEPCHIGPPRMDGSQGRVLKGLSEEFSGSTEGGSGNLLQYSCHDPYIIVRLLTWSEKAFS